MSVRFPRVNYSDWREATRDITTIIRSLINDEEAPYRWRSMRVPLIATQGGGLNAPGIIQFRDDGAGSTGVYGAAFDQTVEEAVLFEVELPEDYKEGTDLICQVHWSPGSSSSTNTVRWGLEYTVQIVGSAFPTTSTISVEDAGSGTPYDHQSVDFAAIDGSALAIEAVLVGRFFRDATHANDNFAADAFGLELRIEYQCDTARGSHRQDSKWPIG